jgi:hypothetical protein
MVAIQDETGINLCPSGDTTFAQVGDNNVKLIGFDDHRQYTVGII